MNTMKTFVALTGMLASFSAWTQDSDSPAQPSPDWQARTTTPALLNAYARTDSQSYMFYPFGSMDGAAPEPGARLKITERASGIRTSYSQRIGAAGTLRGSMEMRSGPLLDVPPSHVHSLFDGYGQQAGPVGDWMNADNAGFGISSVGYSWGALQFESATVSRPERTMDPARKPDKVPFFRRDGTSRRLVFTPAPQWELQLSRGQLSNLDQLETGRDVRRTAISATYTYNFNAADWKTTLAWGRNSGTLRERSSGYLVESTVKVSNVHAFFGRVEQVGSDDLLRENESLQRQAFKMNKLTLGYFYNVRDSGRVWFDVGGLVTRHFVPAGMTDAYGSEPTSFLMFIRFKLQ